MNVFNAYSKCKCFAFSCTSTYIHSLTPNLLCSSLYRTYLLPAFVRNVCSMQVHKMKDLFALIYDTLALGSYLFTYS